LGKFPSEHTASCATDNPQKRRKDIKVTYVRITFKSFIAIKLKSAYAKNKLF
jgi:hypothetical protein